ncbi:sensor histidine kinase [Marinobacter orientalis]|uniref:Signal transduction histidine-protein kinase/phosphatase MprB n=1 Tax=Marinobacter orientalis TaxID=1928859 RepID=A0A7Y0RE13_9GAMM|nr:HAMP domain-containing sensor histidine kinase [Marinobacter orientalis]NMT64514.1 HAMP domain-containing histidine kinase [Marinobacter orientalis]TGX50531.1 HAMP domain-containing histidine kinase [Marinobacter orientalis]
MSRGLRFSLFWRIFISIWLAMALTMIVGNLVTHTLKDRERQAIERQAGLQELAAEALSVRENEGRGDAWSFLKEQGSKLDLHLFLIETDHEEGNLPESIRERMESGGWYRQRPAVIEVAEGYRLVAWPRLNGDAWLNPRFFQWLELALAFVIITLACVWVARLVSRPLKHMESTARTIAAGDNSLRVSDGIARRRDEVGALATAFNDMTAQLCNLLDRQTHLLRDISHDLRTPLTRQRIAIELASEGGADDDLMASILRQNERLEAMTSQILTLYRVSEQGGDIAREGVRPVRVINDVLRDAADYAEHRGVDCLLTISPDCRHASVLGDRGLLQRAFDNILQNALDHTPPGRKVHVALCSEQQQLVLEVRDEGPGVPNELLPHLFEPFYRADKSRGGKGWGLGLAIARDIVATHDGSIEAFNAEQGGLVVVLRLPLFTGGS